MKWISNTFDPGRPDWEQMVRAVYPEDPDLGVDCMRGWLRDKTIGEPRAQAGCTPEELKAEGIVGAYEGGPHAG